MLQTTHEKYSDHRIILLAAWRDSTGTKAMKGNISVRIRNNKNEYAFTLTRNITVLCGDSGTGKTTLYRMVSDFSREGKNSGIHAQISDGHPITVLEGNFWQDDIQKIRDSVVLVDEDSSFLGSEDFARAVRGSSNYFLLITRNYLYQLPYSVEEIYRVKGKKKKHFEKVWLEQEQMYHKPLLPILPFRPELMITEDSNAGFDFFSALCRQSGIDCVSAHGKGNILRLVKQHADRKIVVVADGAAFGPEIEELVQLEAHTPGALALFLPESFEWLVLRSGLVSRQDLPQLIHPEEYADSSKYFSWERYFSDLLVQLSGRESYMRYRKERLSPYYLQETSVQKILNVVKGIKI